LIFLLGRATGCAASCGLFASVLTRGKTSGCNPPVSRSLKNTFEKGFEKVCKSQKGMYFCTRLQGRSFGFCWLLKKRFGGDA
jgi:hypothetical protein